MIRIPLLPALLCLGLGLVAAPPAQAGQLLVDHVQGATLDGKGQLQRFEAMLVEDGKVLATGSHADMAERAAPDAAVLDGQGRSLLPGLIDAHGHVGNLGRMKIQADLTGTASLEATLAQVRAYAAARPDDPWLLGRGWNQVLWKLDRFPTAKELDAAVADRPAWFERVDGHAAWANSAAMKRAGIDRNTKDPVGGRIERDAEGNPSGVFVDNAMKLVELAVPKQTDQQLAAGLDAALAEMASVGLTGVGDAGIDPRMYALYKQRADAGTLSARIYAMLDEIDPGYEVMRQRGPLIGYGNDFLTVRAVKVYADGALGSRGAALIEPYSDAPGNRGLQFETPAVLTAKIAHALEGGFQVGVHAIGDGGNRETLDAFEAAYKLHPEAIELRNRIEHAQVVSLQDIPRFRSLQIIASMQPTHATSDKNMAEDRVGPERIKGAYAWRRFLDQGTRIAGGSDFPVESTNPFFGIHAAVTRQDHDNQPPGGWYPEQAMSVVEALRAFTLDAAYAQHAETTLGTLEPGKHADFILVDQDIFSVDPGLLWKTKVLETWVGGKRMYER